MSHSTAISSALLPIPVLAIIATGLGRRFFKSGVVSHDKPTRAPGPQAVLTDLALVKKASKASMLSLATLVEGGLAKAAMICPCLCDGTSP